MRKVDSSGQKVNDLIAAATKLKAAMAAADVSLDKFIEAKRRVEKMQDDVFRLDNECTESRNASYAAQTFLLAVVEKL